jgi:hypothetical protein
MKIDTFYHYLFYKIFKLLMQRTSAGFTWIATILVIVAMEMWAMIALIGGVGYLFERELFTDNNIWTFSITFAIMLLVLNMLIFGGRKKLSMQKEAFDNWPVTEHTKYSEVVSVLSYVLVIHSVIWASWMD